MGSKTIQDVADRAQVSISTVSRFINGSRLKVDTRERIEEAISALGYKKNQIASSMRAGKSKTIGLLICSPNEVFQFSVLSAIEAELAKNGYAIMVANYSGYDRYLAEKVDMLTQRGVDGIILYFYTPSPLIVETLNQLTASGIPVVLLDSETPEIQADKVLVDNMNASFRAIEAIIHQGHRDIAVITGEKGHIVSDERLNGYLECMKAYGLPIRDGYIRYGHFSITDSHAAALELLSMDPCPTALFTASYHMTFGAVMAIKELGIRVPEDISLIGFDHIDISEAVMHDLSVIEQPVERIGAAACEAILKRLDGGRKEPYRIIRIPTRLVLRKSIGRVPAGRENGLF
jgi:LacI family transcriptional regulator